MPSSKIFLQLIPSTIRQPIRFKVSLSVLARKIMRLMSILATISIRKKLASEHLFSQEWIVLYLKTSSFNLKDSNAYDLIEKTYYTEGLSVRPSKEKVLKTFYTTADGKEITLNDIVADKVTFRKTLKEILPETTEKQAHEQLIKSFEGED